MHVVFRCGAGAEAGAEGMTWQDRLEEACGQREAEGEGTTVGAERGSWGQSSVEMWRG